MKFRFIVIGALLLSACVSQPSGMMNHQMNGMQHGGGMMGNSQTGTDGFLPGQGSDVSTLPEAKPSTTIDVVDGQTITLNPMLVRKTINGKEMVMYGYNGEIPGPLLKVKQGSTFTVNVKNNIDLPTTIHWHGVRLDSQFDGSVGVSQNEIAPGGNFTYTVKVPDDGIYWYHTHVREDLEQPMGLYGGILVTPKDTSTLEPVNDEHVIFVSDLLVDDSGAPIPYGVDQPDHTLMGRFGNMFLMNGSEEQALQEIGQQIFSTKQGSVVRLYLVNAANTRTLRFAIGDGKMKLVGGDNGPNERDKFVNDVTLAPSERAIVDVYFPRGGGLTSLNHQPLSDDSKPNGYRQLGNIAIAMERASPSYKKEFDVLQTHPEVVKSIDAFRSFFDKSPDHTLILDMNMMGGMGGMRGSVPVDGIEWEDDTGMMNAATMGQMMQWKMIDQESGAANKDLLYTVKVGDKVKIRIINKKDSPHPMQHPIHFHGQRFLVLSDNGVKNDNLAWKDTVLVPAGHTVDILLDASNPGDWMFHCHIAEHLENGMMGMLSVK